MAKWRAKIRRADKLTMHAASLPAAYLRRSVELRVFLLGWLGHGAVRGLLRRNTHDSRSAFAKGYTTKFEKREGASGFVRRPKMMGALGVEGAGFSVR